MGYFMPVAESVANGFFLGYYLGLSISVGEKLFFISICLINFSNTFNLPFNYRSTINWLKSPNCTNRGYDVLSVVELNVIAKTLGPRVVGAALRRTPILATIQQLF